MRVLGPPLTVKGPDWPHDTPGFPLLDPKWHVEDTALVSFAYDFSINRLIADFSLKPRKFAWNTTKLCD